MTYLSENPWPVVSVLGGLALVLLIAMWVTQQGKYLVWAGVLLALAALVLAIEQFWVTDSERIEAVVYDIAKGVEASDADRVAQHLAPEAVVTMSGMGVGGGPVQRAVRNVMGRFVGVPVTRELLGEQLHNYKFDFVNVSKLRAEAHPQSRTGKAEFLVHLMGQQADPYQGIGTDPAGLSWSLGFRETAPGEWKVTRITPARTEELRAFR